MTIIQQSKYAPCPEGWHRFNFKHYREVLNVKAGINARRLKALELEKEFKRTQSIIH
jgi:hypothetical protein